MRAKAIMVLGTSSHVGKSLLTAGLCRIFSDAGVSVAPFKSQNMSLNSAATIEGLEIGRAQALQAEAARTQASVHMNPILLKPAGNMTSQVVVRGKIWGRLSASEYHRRRVEELLPVVRESYGILAEQYDVIILEGAGSPAEINLKQHDIVNMRMAEMADARCVLVGDIDRGGVFASLFGTVQLLEPEEQERIAGFIVNKFRGDVALLEPGLRMMEERLGKPCLGVVPYMHGLALEEEDSLGLDTSGGWADGDGPERPLRIAVIALPSFSNFTDFDALRAEPSVSLRFCRDAGQLARADVVIVPGSKQTVDDLLWMGRVGLDKAVIDHAERGLGVGICGGMQMLGTVIVDAHGVEREGHTQGLGLLPFATHMNPEKVTRKAAGRLCAPILFGQAVAPVLMEGYEIHVGETAYGAGAQAFATLHDGEPDGCVSADTRIFATYLHGLFDDDAFRRMFIDAARSFHALSPGQEFADWKQLREQSFDRLAATLRASLDMARLFEWAGLDHHAPVERELVERSL